VCNQTDQYTQAAYAFVPSVFGEKIIWNDIDKNCLLGQRKKIAKFLMRTFTYRSTFLYARN
jgi:hypothetical protein